MAEQNDEIKISTAAPLRLAKLWMADFQTSTSPPLKLDWSQRRFSHCQAWEDGCEYERCPRWKDGKIVNDAHCALDLIGRDEDV